MDTKSLLHIHNSWLNSLVVAYRMHPADYQKIKVKLASDEKYKEINQVMNRPPGAPTLFGIELYVDNETVEGYPVPMSRRDVEEFLERDRQKTYQYNVTMPKRDTP